jgi:hypothetical protein
MSILRNDWLELAEPGLIADGFSTTIFSRSRFPKAAPQQMHLNGAEQMVRS